MKRLALLAFLLCFTRACAEMPAPATVEFMFDPAASHGVKLVSNDKTQYLKSVDRTGGAVTNQWWHVTPASIFGEGNLLFHLDRSRLDGDLALVLRIDWQTDTNIAVQLLDEKGRAVALDLFGEMKHNARAVGTDTFVVPLSRYPGATTVSVRRLSGDLRVLGGGLYPVLSEVASKAENEKALAEQLGVIVSPHHWMFAQGNTEGAAPKDSAVGEVHALLSLSKTNEVGAAALAQPGYPVYKPLTTGALIPPKITSSNTSEGIITNALRTIALRVGDKVPEVAYTSSAGVADSLLHEDYQVGFMSIALSSAEKEEFFRSRGFSIVEIRFARDAIQTLVNAENPIRSVTVPQLDAIFGTELKAGAPKLIRDWNQLGSGNGSVKAAGGYPEYGTSRVFQQLVLKAGEFRSDLVKTDVVYDDGVEGKVADDVNAIGFATLRVRSPKVRAIAIATNSGEAAYRPDADSIYSGKYLLQRMLYSYIAAPSLHKGGAFEQEIINLLLSDIGQTLVARAGSLPLLASEVVTERRNLGLPH
jgi:phosphate transport system substrate-binding protein